MILQQNHVSVQKVSLNGMVRIVSDATQVSSGVISTRCAFNVHKIHTTTQLMDLAQHALLPQLITLTLCLVFLSFVPKVRTLATIF